MNSILHSVSQLGLCWQGMPAGLDLEAASSQTCTGSWWCHLPSSNELQVVGTKN
jgi:hypothetical protein